MRFIAKTILLATISLLFAPSTSAQISLDDLPEVQGNSRFYNDALSVVEHPSLTLDGFDSGPDNGLGLKQVLEEVYSVSPDSSVKIVWEDIVVLASDGGFNHSPSSRSDIISNTRRMQARAFMALATYVIERSGEGQVLSSLPSNIDTPAEAAE